MSCITQAHFDVLRMLISGQQRLGQPSKSGSLVSACIAEAHCVLEFPPSTQRSKYLQILDKQRFIKLFLL